MCLAHAAIYYLAKELNKVAMNLDMANAPSFLIYSY